MLFRSRWKGIPVRAHWTVPFGALFFTGFAFAPLAWLAFFSLILVHEAGHALLARRYGHHVVAIDLTGFGGLCRWSGYATDRQRAVIAWGGVIAQALLFAVTALVVLLVGSPHGPLAQVTDVFLRTNLWIMALNLLPFPPLDGAQAWSILRHLRRPTRREPPRGEPPAPRPLAASPELAELLRRLGDDARRARRS